MGLLALVVLLQLAVQTMGISMVCSWDLYGRPSVSDSAAIAKALPFAKDDPDRQINVRRVFAEPAFLKPKFSALKNRWPYNKMVQLPLIWRYSESKQSFEAVVYMNFDGNNIHNVLTGYGE